MSVSELRVSIRLLHPFREVLEAEGVQLEPLLAKAGISPAVFGDPDARIERLQAGRFFYAAQAATRRPALGLRAARHHDAAQFHLLEYLAASSADGEAAIEGFLRHQQVFSDARRLGVESRPEGKLLRYHLSPDVPRVVIEFTIGSLALAIQRSSGWRPHTDRTRVWFEYSEPADSAAYVEFFGVRPRFDAPATGLLFAPEKLKRPMQRANPRVQEVMERQLEEVGRKAAAMTQAGRVRDLLAGELAGTPMGLSEVARRMYMSPSTLKRRLAEEGTTYRDVLEDLRHDTARQLLMDSEASVREIACRLGYRDIAAFSRAFRRWSGKTPSEYRSRAR
ncbi:MAG: AraC family transcriptional regulator [Myxococcales bacterium]|nr:AraC family transcriptional regulator [Myxococcales bacterium]